MDISQQIKKFDAENKPFYMVDHGDGEHSLCLPLSSLKGEYNDFWQEAFNQYAIWAGEPITDGRFYTHGDGYEWEYVFAKAFEGEENLKKISFDCEAGGFFCYSRDFDVLAEYGRRFREMCISFISESKKFWSNSLDSLYSFSRECATMFFMRVPPVCFLGCRKSNYSTNCGTLFFYYSTDKNFTLYY